MKMQTTKVDDSAVKLNFVENCFNDGVVKAIFQYYCTSNVDLAVFTNVNRRWRAVVLKYLKDGFKMAIEGRQSDRIYDLLLPDMGLDIVKRRLGAMKLSPLVQRESPLFCLAWFHPRGIKIQSLDLSQTFDVNNHFEIDENYKKHLRKATNVLKKGSNTKSVRQAVTDEWQGYQDATDVLLPFGYATAFVRSFLQFAIEYDLDTQMLRKSLIDSDKIRKKEYDAENVTKARRTTFSVRGATFARPHGYCLCWEDVSCISEVHRELSKIDDTNSDEYRALMHSLKAMKQQDMKRRMRMKDSLPRICSSTLAKNPDYHSPFGQIEGRRQRCIQFLNAEKSRAVYMRTPPFDCGPIQAPVTMFMVGIATEDGCFVSGLTKRFELGHMSYGNESADSLVELSAVCMATESSTNNSRSGTDYYQSSSPSDSDDSSVVNCSRTEDRGDMNCQCKIQVKRKYDNVSSYDDDEDSVSSVLDVEETHIVRGALGPGRWHLYTAVFDGNNSMIRIDGMDEPMSLPTESFAQHGIPSLDGLTIGSDHAFNMSLCFGEGSDGEGAGSISELAVFKGKMNLEDMEVVENYLMKKHGIIYGSVGFIDDQKPNLMSSAKMDRMPALGKLRDKWQEDRWMRDAHSLMMHYPPVSPPSGGRIPLRVAARHRSVAWHRCCEVTGMPVRVSRIGSKLSNGSSDW